jgi:hypothetical protein
VMAEYFGPNSTRPSRNGYCVEAFWTKLQTLSGGSTSFEPANCSK